MSLIDALDPEQRRAAEHLRGPLVIIAGAGTGKTRAITHRIAHGVRQGVYAGPDVLAVTFTQRAAGEMRGRLANLGAANVQARTFHSAALRQLKYFWPLTYGGDLPTVTASKLALVAQAAKAEQIASNSALLRDMAAEIEWSKVSNVTVENYVQVATAAGRSISGLDLGTMANVISQYEIAKRESGRMDMEDILLMTTALLASEPDIARQIRAQYRHFVVDEYQDVSPLQHGLLRLWLGDRDDICVVGDPNQTIYSFTGATSDYLINFTKEFENATRVDLVRNYRSTPQIVAAANEVWQENRGVVLNSQNPAGSEVTYFGGEDEASEINRIVSEIKKLNAGGTALKEIAVLFRINAQLEAFEEALDEADIPYVVRGVERFYERPEVRQAIALIQAAARAEPNLCDQLANEIAVVLSSVGYTEKPPQTRGAVRERWESFNALVTLADEVEKGTTLEQFALLLKQRSENAHAPSAEGVTLATLHSAKGLEWDAVFLAHMHEGSMPSSLSTTPAQIAEERRLFYVGITRARKHLHISWSRTRAGRGNRNPSRFIGKKVEITKSQPAPIERRVRSVVKCRVCNKVLSSGAERKTGHCETCPVEYDRELYEALRNWRSEQAESQKVPAYVVFTDATLMAVAENGPSTLSQLGQIRGIGPAKLDRYGEALLEMCRQSSKPGR